MADISHQRMLEEIMEVSDKICSPWEIDFLESIQRQVSQGRTLSDKQAAVLERIYKKACESAY